MIEKRITALPLSKIMQKDVVTVSSEDTLDKVASIFKYGKFHHLPVININFDLIGIISTTDFDKFSWGKSFFNNDRKAEINEMLYKTNRTVDIMTPHVYTLRQDQSVAEAIQSFQKFKFRAIPIVEGEKVVGIITPMDILNFIAKE